MTTIQQKADNPVAHLTDEDIESIGRELDAIRAEVVLSRGERDAAYIRTVIDVQRKLELASRGCAAAVDPAAGLVPRHRRTRRSPRSWRTWRSATT